MGRTWKEEVEDRKDGIDKLDRWTHQSREIPRPGIMSQDKEIRYRSRASAESIL